MSFEATMNSHSHHSAREQLDEHISSISKGLIPDDYSYVLDLLSESLTSHPASTEDLETVVHLSILFLRDHPQREQACRSSITDTDYIGPRHTEICPVVCDSLPEYLCRLASIYRWRNPVTFAHVGICGTALF